MTITFPDWFSQYIPTFGSHLNHLAGQPKVQALQIGAYTGDASVWLLDNILTGPGSALIDVDTWEGSDEPAHARLDWGVVWGVYRHRVMGKPVTPYRMTSDTFFRNYVGPQFDFIYIDGDHHPEQVALDGVNADELLKVGGILAFDDYLWDIGDGHAPRPAIDEFLTSNADRYETLAIHQQVWLRKLADR